MNRNSGESNDARDVIMGFALGAAAGAAFGGMFAVWFRHGLSFLSLMIMFHAAVAGAAMGGWLLPTLRSE